MSKKTYALEPFLAAENETNPPVEPGMEVEKVWMEIKRKGDLADPLDGDRAELEDPADRLPHIETHTEIQTLKCILTAPEIKTAGDLMAQADGERVDSEAVLRSISAQYKAKIAAAEAVVSSEASKIRTGYEFRAVEVKVEFDHAKGTVEKFRTDTFECIEQRRMTEYEAQRTIRF
jgi:hypothetical protein